LGLRDGERGIGILSLSKNTTPQAYIRFLKSLFHIPTVRVTRGIVREKAEYKERDKDTDNDINNNFKGQHERASASGVF
jgi:hypothetical protein